MYPVGLGSCVMHSNCHIRARIVQEHSLYHRLQWHQGPCLLT